MTSVQGFLVVLMRLVSRLSMLGVGAVTVFVTACGFSPKPQSGLVGCDRRGGPCCPDGYVCVGRTSDPDANPSPGTCWYKEDLPPAAM